MILCAQLRDTVIPSDSISSFARLIIIELWSTRIVILSKVREPFHHSFFFFFFSIFDIKCLVCDVCSYLLFLFLCLSFVSFCLLSFFFLCSIEIWKISFSTILYAHIHAYTHLHICIYIYIRGDPHGSQE